MNQQPRTIELEGKPDFDRAMERVYAWFDNEMLDRPPVRFSATNADYNAAAALHHQTLKDRWFDAEYQVDSYLDSIRRRQFHGETFPVFWPNLGPGIYAAFHGATLEFGDVTSWTKPLVLDWDDIGKVRLDTGNEYFRKIEELTRVALEKCPGKALVGYTDIHGSLDCVADWRGTEQLCMDLIEAPEKAIALRDIAVGNFHRVFGHFDRMLKDNGQLSVTWMGIPSFGTMHIPSCDFATCISPAMFDEFYLPILEGELEPMTHVVYHVDGRGVAHNLDRLLSIPKINAIQWVQGVGDDLPIMQWLPLIRKVQAAGKSVLVDLQLSELTDFMREMDPRGLYLCIAADESIQPEILRRLERWAAA